MELKDYIITRYNTIFFDLKAVENRMNESDILEFFECTGVNIDDVMAMDLNVTRKRAMLKFNEKKEFQAYLLKHPTCLAPLEHCGKRYNVPMHINDGNTKVLSISDLPIEAEDRYLIELLAPYGNVINLRRRGFNSQNKNQKKIKPSQGITVLINLKNNIPIYLTLGGVKIHVKYDGQTPTCPICSATEHNFTNCPENKIKEIQEKVKWSQKQVVQINQVSQKRKENDQSTLTTSTEAASGESPTKEPKPKKPKAIKNQKTK